MNAMTRRIVYLLSIAATYGCILILLDIGNYYASIFSWSGQSSRSWQISSALLVVLAAIALICDFMLRPWGRKVSGLVFGRQGLAPQKG